MVKVNICFLSPVYSFLNLWGIVVVFSRMCLFLDSLKPSSIKSYDPTLETEIMVILKKPMALLTPDIIPYIFVFIVITKKMPCSHISTKHASILAATRTLYRRSINCCCTRSLARSYAPGKRYTTPCTVCLSTSSVITVTSTGPPKGIAYCDFWVSVSKPVRCTRWTTECTEVHRCQSVMHGSWKSRTHPPPPLTEITFRKTKKRNCAETMFFPSPLPNSPIHCRRIYRSRSIKQIPTLTPILFNPPSRYPQTPRRISRNSILVSPSHLVFFEAD